MKQLSLRELFKKPAFLFSLVMLVICSVFFATSLGYDFRTRVVPFFTGLLGILLCLISLVTERYPAIGRRLTGGFFNTMATAKAEATAPKDAEEAERQESGEKGRHDGKNLLITLLLICASFFVIVLVGFIIGASMSIFAWIKWRGHRSWLKATSAGLITGMTLFFLFEKIAGLKLFSGIIFGGIIT
jgi:hypothetical protein